MIQLQPIKDRLLVEPLNPEQKTSTGLVLPPGAQKQKDQGIVLAVGEEIEHIKAGDKIVYAQYSGEEFEFEKKKYLFLRIEDVYAKINS